MPITYQIFFGWWDAEILKIVKDFRKEIQEVIGEKRAISYLLQNLSVIVQLGNAISKMGKVGPTQKHDVTI